MSICRLTLMKVAVPLKKVVRHASFERSVSENLIVRVQLSDGIVGYGEGVPCAYVTGETLESAFAALEAQDSARVVGRPIDFASAVTRTESLTLPEIERDPRGMGGNAARCALELAILDAYGRRFGEPIGRAIDLARIEGLRRFPGPAPVRYSAAITAESARGERISAWKIRIYGFNQVKVKVGAQGQDDTVRLRRMRRILGRRMDIRLDANEAWPAAELVERRGRSGPLPPRRSNNPFHTRKSIPWRVCAGNWAFPSCSTSRCAGSPMPRHPWPGAPPICGTSGSPSVGGSSRRCD